MREVALELNINHHTAKNWMKRGHPDRAGTSAGKEKRPQDWRASEQLQALNETHGFSSEALQAWCRERGLFAHQPTHHSQTPSHFGRDQLGQVQPSGAQPK